MNTYDVNDLDFIKNRSRTNNFFHKDLWALALLHKGQYNSLLHFEQNDKDEKGFQQLLQLALDLDNSNDEVIVMGSDGEEIDTNVMTFASFDDDFDDILNDGDEDDEKASELKKTKGKMRNGKKKTWKDTINDVAKNNDFQPPPTPKSHQQILRGATPIEFNTQPQIDISIFEQQIKDLKMGNNLLQYQNEHLKRQNDLQTMKLQQEIRELRNNLQNEVDNDAVMKENKKISDLESRLKILQIEKEKLQQNFQEQVNANTLLKNQFGTEKIRFENQLRESQFLVKQEREAKANVEQQFRKFRDDKDKDDSDKDGELQKVKSGLVKAESQMALMKTKLESLELEKTSWSSEQANKNDLIQNEMKKLDTQRKQLENNTNLTLQQRESKIKSLENEMRLLNDRIQQYEQEFEKKNQILSSKDDELAKNKQKLELLSTQVADFTTRKEEYDRDRDGKEKQIISLQSKLQEIESKMSQETQSKQEVEREKEEVSAKLQEYIDNFGLSKDEKIKWENKIQLMMKELEQTKKSKLQVESEFGGFKNQKRRDDDEAIRIKTQNESLIQEAQLIKKQIELLQNQVKSSQQSTIKVQNQFDILQKQKKDDDDERGKILAENTEMKEYIIKAQTFIEEMKTAYNNKELDVKQRDMKIKELETNMNKQHIQALSEIFVKDESLKQMTTQINQISNEKMNLEKQVSNLSTTLQVSHQREQQLQGQMVERTKQVQALQDRIQIGMKQLSQGNQQVQKMKNIISNMTSQQQQQMMEQQMLNVQNQNLSQQLENERNAHRQQIQKERKQIQQMMNDIKSSHTSDDDSKDADDVDMSAKNKMKQEFQLKVIQYENMFENGVPNDVREHYNKVIRENNGKIDNIDRIRLIKQHIYAHQKRIQGLYKRRLRFLKMYQNTPYEKQLEQVWNDSGVANVQSKD